MSLCPLSLLLLSLQMFSRGSSISNGTKLAAGSVSSEEQQLDAEWACGTDDFSRFIAESTIEKDCPERKNAINNCCVAHDRCYDDQLGQRHCDDIFCACLEREAEGSPMCSKDDAPYFCQLVRQFGENFYNASAKLDGKSPIVPVNANGGRKQRRAVRGSKREQPAEG